MNLNRGFLEFVEHLEVGVLGKSLICLVGRAGPAGSDRVRRPGWYRFIDF